MRRLRKSPIANGFAFAVLFLVVAQSFAKDDEDKEGSVKDRVAELETLVASLRADLAAHKANASAHHVKTTSFGDLTDKARDHQVPYAATCGDADTVDGKHATELDPDDLDGRLDDLEDLLIHFSRTGDDIYIKEGNLHIEEANLHVVNGTGRTDQNVNGLGNIIIGYNEERGGGEDDRTGSHMLVVGKYLNYSSYGGIIAGQNNTTSNDFAAVLGGYGNLASGYGAIVSGGESNKATGNYSAISGGDENEATSYAASVSGGRQNRATGFRASVTGGFYGTASGDYATVSGGRYRTQSGKYYWRAGDLTANP